MQSHFIGIQGAFSAKRMCLILGSVSLLALTPTLVQAEDGLTLEEITVTASKSGAAALQDIPATIQAITGDTLERIGAVEFSDFAVRVPGLQFQDLGPGDKEYIIRGINSSGPSTVGVYYDEAVITGSNAEDGGGRNADIRLYDLERIEVLKGPQGTLYGANSMSGTIRFITNKPVLDQVEGYVQGEVSDTHSGGTNFNLNGMVNFPIIQDKLALRAVGWINDNSGYIDAVRIPSGPVYDINTDNTEGMRTALRLQASDVLTIDASVTIQQTQSNGSSRFTPPGVASFGSDNFPSIPGGDLINTDITQSPWDENLQIYSLTATYDMEHGVITATTNWFNRNINFYFDSTAILISFDVDDAANTLEPQKRRIWSNEIRYASNYDGPLNFVVGGYIQDEAAELEVQVIHSNEFGMPNGPFSSLNEEDALTGSGDTYFGRVSTFDLSQKAIFGEVTYDITEQFSALVGMRYFDSSYKSSNRTTHPFAGFSDNFVRDTVFQNASSSKTTFKFNLSYKATDDLLVYATASQGFRVGGVNQPTISEEVTVLPSYNPDTLWNYEIGLKSSFMDNRVNLNIAAYTMRWKDIQVQGRDISGAFTFLTNAGKASVDGVEVELTALVSEGLEFFAGMSYQNGRLTEDAPDLGDASRRPLKGNPIPNIPKFQASSSLTYTRELSNGYNAVLHADLTYRGSSHTEFNPADSLRVKLNSFALVNLRASVEKDDWKLSVFAKNLFDNRAQIDAINGTQDPLAFVTARPRTIGLSVKRSF